MITRIYHEHCGVCGYRQMKVYLERKGIHLSKLTVHKYMKGLGLYSIVRRKKPGYEHKAMHKRFPNILE